MDANATGDMEERVILVDERDREVGTRAKLSAHVDGKLHRAVSVFVFDADENMLLQRRAAAKYHSGGLWSNTCCGHPRPGESSEEAAHRRLREEMGFDCRLRPVLNFIYRSELENGLFEHEYDHVFVGRFEGTPAPNPDEVDDWRWVSVEDVTVDELANPKRYSVWFAIALKKLRALPHPFFQPHTGYVTAASQQGRPTERDHRDTPATYSADEAARIREMFAQLDSRLICPRCSEQLTVSTPVTRRGSTIQEVSCPGCYRCIVVRDLPERHASG